MPKSTSKKPAQRTPRKTRAGSKSRLDTVQAVHGHSVFVRVSIEISIIALCATAIGAWYILAFPAFFVNEPLTAAAFGNDPSNSVRLSWTAPGDDETIGRATEYDVRYAVGALDETGWGAATPAGVVPPPQSSGLPESTIVTGLMPKTSYVFAVKTRDEAGNWSAISNIAAKTTSCLEAWSCSAWGSCVNQLQTRTCTDLNLCDTSEQKPMEQQACSADGPPPPVGGEDLTLQESFVVVAPNRGTEPRIKVFRRDGTLLSEFLAYAKGFRGGIRVAVGDLGKDGIDEIVVAPGPGAEPVVKIFSYKGKLIQKFTAYEKNFRGGVNVAIGNIDGKAAREIVTLPASKASSEIRVFSFQNKKYVASIKKAFAFPERYRGGWNLATADLDHNGTAEVMVTPGEAAGGPQVKVFEFRNKKLSQRGSSVMVFPKSFRGGVSLATGDTNADRRAEVFVVPEARGAAHIRIYGRKFDGGLKLLSPGFHAFHKNFTGGAVLAAGDFTYDGRDEIVAAVRTGDQTMVRIYRANGKEIISEFHAFPLDNHNGISGLAVGHFFAAQ